MKDDARHSDRNTNRGDSTSGSRDGGSAQSDIRKVQTQLARSKHDLHAAAAATAAAWSHADLAPEWQSVFCRIARAQEEVERAELAVAEAMARLDGCDRRRPQERRGIAAAELRATGQ